MHQVEHVETIEKIRKTYIDFVKTLNERRQRGNTSLGSIDRVSLAETLKEAVENTQNIRMRRKCDGTFTCTFIGASSAGKTTFLKELFPDLEERGWLQTASTDTTSQGLVINYAEQDQNTRIESYTFPELKAFFELTKEDAERNGVIYQIDDATETIYVDGENINPVDSREKANFDLAKQGFIYDSKFSLKPFRDFEVPQSNDGTNQDIKNMTTMEVNSDYRNSSTGYNALQLRALVKKIHLTSKFEHLLQLVNPEDREIIKKIEFIDTPGQGTNGIVKRDEVLYYTLYEKSRSIVEQLWQDDELDFLVHMIRCGYQSNFGILWNKIKDKLGDEMKNLEDRLILLLNSTRQFFLTKDIAERCLDSCRDEDQIYSVIQRNILLQIVPGGMLPAAICFTDTLAAWTTPEETTLNVSKETLEYRCAKCYQDNRDLMLQWAQPGKRGYNSLNDLKLLENDRFQANVDSLCDTEDRGQGFFLKTLVDAIKNQGSEMLFKKHIVRSKLEDDFERLEYEISDLYTEDGKIKDKQLEESLENFVAQYRFRYSTGINDFAVRYVDPLVDDYVADIDETTVDRMTFSTTMFQWLCDSLLKTIFQNREIVSNGVLGTFLAEEVDNIANKNQLCDNWGYRSAVNNINRDLFKHLLKIHAREFLELMFFKKRGIANAQVHQSEEDIDAMKSICLTMQTLRENITRLKVVLGL